MRFEVDVQVMDAWLQAITNTGLARLEAKTVCCTHLVIYYQWQHSIIDILIVRVRNSGQWELARLFLTHCGCTR